MVPKQLNEQLYAQMNWDEQQYSDNDQSNTDAGLN